MKLEENDIEDRDTQERELEDIDMQEDYEMVPLEPMMYGCNQMNRMQGMGMEIPMGCMQDVNESCRINSLMRMNQNTGINPWMGMGQFNEDMFMNDFESIDRMDEDVSINDYEEDNEESGQLDKYEEKEVFRDQYNKLNPQYNDVDAIVRRIEKYNPAIFRRLTRCGIPYAEAREIVRKIVHVSLMYRDE